MRTSCAANCDIRYCDANIYHILPFAGFHAESYEISIQISCLYFDRFGYRSVDLVHDLDSGLIQIGQILIRILIQLFLYLATNF